MAFKQGFKRMNGQPASRLGGAGSPLAAVMALARELAPVGNAATDVPPARLDASGDPSMHLESMLGATKPWQAAVRVAVYSDEPILAAGFQSLIAADPSLKLTASCDTMSKLKKQLAGGNLDVAVVDFTEEITAATLAQLRKLAAHCKLILLTNSIEGDLALRALTFGIRGVLRKTLPLEAHRQCLHRVSAGELWFEKQMPESVN